MTTLVSWESRLLHTHAAFAKFSAPTTNSTQAFHGGPVSLADWLGECGVETVVMESTGVYWIPLFGVLEERGFR